MVSLGEVVLDVVLVKELVQSTEGLRLAVPVCEVEGEVRDGFFQECGNG